MPHQCLKCGRIFEEGSSQLLKGCSDCGGNRFFFTKEPLTEEERKVISHEMGKDINSTIIDLVGENKDILDKSGKWVKIKPGDIRKALEHLSEEKASQDKKEGIDLKADEEHRKIIVEKLESNGSDTPGTIHIEKPGMYNIDLKGLLEEEPIIIQKDGSYIIHLPSIFKMLDKEKK